MTAFHRLPLFAAPAVLIAGGFLLLTGCGPTTGLMSSSLEDDELYLRRGEAFTTDAEYMAFALEQAGLGEDGLPDSRSAQAGDDYYDPDRANRSMNDMRYSPNFGLGSGIGAGGYNNFGNWGMMPSAYFGMGSPGMNTWGNPWNNGWNNGWGNGWNNGWGASPYGYGNSPWMGSGWGPAYGYGGYPYGYNNWNNGGWWGSTAGNDNWGTGSGVISGLRVPLSSNTGNNSSYGENGLFAKPRSLANPGEPHPGEVRPNDLIEPNLAPASNPAARPAAQGPRLQRLLETPSVPSEIREPNAPDNRFNVDPQRYTPPAARPSTSPSRSNSNSSRPSNTPTYTPSRSNSAPSTSPSRSTGGGSSPSRGSGGRRP